ncbi:MAG TPA: DinB family protein [Acidimicrobiales bacterium]|nr:DinB family protein [Acidimicrobiales bacterium]
MGVKAELVGLSRFAAERTKRRLDGLTDEELLWEPVPHCWSIRLRDGRPVADGTPGAPTPAFTTIGWLVWHLINNYGAKRNHEWLGLDLPWQEDLEVSTGTPPITAADALDRLQRAIGQWDAVLDLTSDELLAEPIGKIGGPYARDSKAAFVLHELDEVIHHAAQISTVRDLFRWSTQSYEPTLLQAVRDGQRRIALALVDAGSPDVDVDETDPEMGATALHFAAGAGDVELIRALLARGADPKRKDRTYGADARGWAEFFGHADAYDDV